MEPPQNVIARARGLHARVGVDGNASPGRANGDGHGRDSRAAGGQSLRGFRAYGRRLRPTLDPARRSDPQGPPQRRVDELP